MTHPEKPTQPESSPDSNFTQIVSEAGEEAYAAFVADHPEIPEAEKPWDSPYCFGISPRLQEKLTAKGVHTNLRSGGGQRSGADDIHDYLETDDGIIICPTWQQMVPERVKETGLDMPKVLVVPRGRLEEVLNFYQVPHIMQVLFNLPEDPDAPWGHDEQTPPAAAEQDAMLRAIRDAINTMRNGNGSGQN